MVWPWRGAASGGLVTDKRVDKYDKKLLGNFPNDSGKHFLYTKAELTLKLIRKLNSPRNAFK